MKYSWKFLKEHIKNGRADIVFERSNEVKLAHQKQRDNSKNDYNNPGDYIKIKYMKWRSFKNANNKLFAVSDSNSENKIILKNAFPYNLRKGIQHYNLFSVIPLNENEIINYINQYIGKKKEIIWFVNYPIYQSIPDLWHCHFFYKS